MPEQIIYEYGSEFDWGSNYKFMQENIKHRYLQEGEYFRSGRDVFRAIALKYKGEFKRVLLPALCCESMVTPFEMNGYDISYFKLNDDITANFEDIVSKLHSGTIFLYMNYFGIPSLSDEKLSIIKESYQNILIVEDRTHDILMPRRNKFFPDFTVISIRKWLAIPDGGILYSQQKKESFPKGMDAYFGDIRNDALKNKSTYLTSGDVQIKSQFRKQLEAANNYLDKSESVVAMSIKSYETLKCVDFYKISQSRQQNIRVLSFLLKSISSIKDILIDTEQTLLYYPILVENRDEVQRKLAQNNIYCPVIWPLPNSAIGVCTVSEYISKNMLALPCDQRYGKSDMEHICKVLEQVLENEK